MPGLFKVPFTRSGLTAVAVYMLSFMLFPFGGQTGHAGQITVGEQKEASQTEFLAPVDLWRFGRISGLQVSADNNSILFLVKEYDLEENKGREFIHVADPHQGTSRRISPEKGGDTHARWRPDGKRIGFIHEDQLWEMDPDGSNRRRISDVSAGITGFAYSPDQKKVLFISPVPAGKPGKGLFNGLDKAGAVLADELMYRHWDTWVKSFSHIFTADYSHDGLSRLTNIMAGMGLESPFRPFGGMEQVTWSPDSRYIAYTARDTDGRQYALTTDSQIMLHDLASGQTTRLDTSSGYDTNPVFSPDGKSLAWLSMETPGYEADKNRLVVMDLDSREIADLTLNFDQTAIDFAWSRDGKNLYFSSLSRGSTLINRLDPASRRIEVLTRRGWTYSAFAPAGGRLVALRSNMSSPNQVVVLDPGTGRAENISKINKNLLDRFQLGEVREMGIRTSDDQDMAVFLILPPGFSPDREYPAVLYCEGGPESFIGHYWSYRWNFQTLAAAGYVIVAPARRGVQGFGREWKKGVLQDWGGLPMQDLLRAADEAAELPWVDEERMAAVGPSFGGFSIYWLAGHHEGRFKALVAHDGIFNLESMYAATEETFFMNKELGGPFWEKNNGQIQETYADSPHNFVRNWDTPLLVIHGGRDYRVPDCQGLAAFNAARLKGIPARLLYFPKESHWVLSPQNSVLWYRTVLDWLDRWTKPGRKTRPPA